MAFVVAVYAELLAPKVKPVEHKLLAQFGLLTYLTVHTNLINVFYFAATVVSPCSPMLRLASSYIWPMAFASAMQLTPLYYCLDHFQPSNVRWRRDAPKMGFHGVSFAAHASHGLATGLALLHARSLDARHIPTLTAGLLVLFAYAVCYLALILVNKRSCGLWPYDIMDDIEARAGPPGVYGFMGLIVLLL